MPGILIGADLCPIEANQPYFVKGDAASLFHDLLPEFEAADLVVANLECPLIERPSPILKTGPTFGEPSNCISGIKNAGIDVLCLSNNHILDHGPAGLQNTLDVCAQAGIAAVGAGRNLSEARKILIRQVAGWRIGILAVAEHEFSIAGKDASGANPLDLIDFVRSVQSHRGDFDYLIVLLHGSAEFHVPTPRIQDTCRFMIETGANAVIVQHPHVLGGYEEYQGGHIVYGQGALVMDEAIYRSRKSFHEGFLVKLTIEKAGDGGQETEDRGQPVRRSSQSEDGRTEDGGHKAEGQGPDRRLRSRMEIIPFVQSDPVPGARKLTGQPEREFREVLAKRSQAIEDPAFVEAEWLKFCQKHQRGYLSAVLGHNRYVRKLDVGGWLTRLLHGRRALLGTRNCLVCETHREALQTIFTRL